MAVWPDTIVEESNLTQNISILRRALGDARGDNAFIATIPGRGYKFVADVRRPAPEPVSVEPVVDTQKPPARNKPAGVFVGAGLIVLVVVGLAAYYLLLGERAGTAKPKVLAILPFKPLVQENSDEALEMGMTDTLIARMSSSSSGLILRPLSSVRPFAQGNVDPQSAGRQLGADSVLEGSIQRWGEKIRANVRLIDVESGRSLWSGTFDDRYTDIFAVQDAISGKVAEALRLRLAGPVKGHTTQNVDAYRLFLQGRLYQFRSTPPDIQRAIGFYEEAIQLDPAYALAYACLADSYRMLPITSDFPAGDAFLKSKEAAQKALELDDQLSQAHVALGYVYSWYEWNWAGAEAEMRKAVELDPNNADAHRGLSILLTALARHAEAISEMQTARELDPLSLPTNALEAQALHFAGRDDEAVVQLNKTFEIDPNFWIARLMLARVLIGEQRWNEALAELEKARTGSGGNTEAISLAGYALARAGRRDEALKMLDELRQRSDESYSPSYNIAILYLGLGERDQALRWLEDAVRRHDVRVILLRVERKWDDLRTDGRFVAVTREVGLE